MAITIISTPRDYAPIYNKMVFTASSTNTANDSFSYLVDIYINGSLTKTIRKRIPARPDGFLEVDIHRVIEQSITYGLVSLTNTLASLDDEMSLLNYQVKFGEEYEVLGVIEQFPDLTVDSERYAFNGSLGRNELIDYDNTDYLATDINSKFLSNAPTTQHTAINDFGCMGIFNYSGTATRIVLATYDENQVIIGTFRFAINASSDLINIVTNPASLNLIDALEFITGVQPVITDSVFSYSFFLADGLDNPASEVITFNIQKCDNKARLIFQNRLGQFDSFNFTKRKDVNTKIERNTYKKIPNRLDLSGVYTESKSDREKVQHYTKTTDSIKVVSDWITEEENNWLLELVESPVIFLEENGERIAIEKIEKTMHESKNNYQDKLFNLELELSLGYDNYRQRG